MRLKFKKNAIIFILILSFVVYLTIPVGADYIDIDGQIYEFEKTASPNSINTFTETVVTKNPDGSITERTYELSAMAMENTGLLSSYQPNINENIASASTDEYGRYRIYPADARIGYLKVVYDSDNDGLADLETAKYGTASLIGHDLLLSCAHVVWKAAYKDYISEGWATTIEFHSGRSGSVFESIDAFSPSISMNYINNTDIYITENGEIASSIDMNYDWALIRIGQDLGSQVGWFGVQQCNGTETGLSVKTIGYPSDKTGVNQWVSPGVITDFIQTNIMRYSAYTVGGNSGGSVFYGENIIGIHSGSFGNSTQGYICGGATRMYPSLFSIIAAEKTASEERWE